MAYPLTARCGLFRFTFFLVIAMVGLPASGQQSPQISERARAIGIQWLLSTCEVGDGGRLKTQLQQVKAELEPFFLQALQQGPDEKQLSDLQRAGEAQYHTRPEVIKSH